MLCPAILETLYYFIKVAPYYYALGIAHHLSHGADNVTESQIRREYSLSESDEHDGWDYLEHSRIFWKGVEFLIEKGLIDKLSDDFGPTILSQSRDFYES